MRFKSSEPTLQELSYVSQSCYGNVEAVILLLESRCEDLDFRSQIRSMPMSELIPLIQEMATAMGANPIGVADLTASFIDDSDSVN